MDFSRKWRVVLPRFSSADAPDATERAVQLALGSLHALTVGDKPDCALELSRSGWAMTIFRTDGSNDVSELGGAGIEVFTGDLAAHLRGSCRACDFVIVQGASEFEAWAGVIRDAHPATALVSALRTAGCHGSGAWEGRR